MPPSSISSIVQRWRPALLVLAVLAAVAAGERAHRGLSEAAVATGEAAWIWAVDDGDDGPAAFLAVRDFELEELLDASPARLLILADEEYQLYLDGTWIGANHYHLGAEIDHYPLAALAAGRHRLVVEARSAAGGGGILVALDPGGGRPERVVSDASWSIHRQSAPGLIEGWAGAGGGDPPRVWGRPPVGRWRKPRLGPERAPAANLASRWATASAPHWVRDADGDVVAGVVIDFGEAQAGYLELWGELLADRRLEVRLAESLGALDGRAPECWLLPVAGRNRWRSPVPRRFRYAWVQGEAPAAARLLAVDSRGLALSDGGELARQRSRGPFGLEAPRSGRYQPLEVDLNDRKKRSP